MYIQVEVFNFLLVALFYESRKLINVLGSSTRRDL